VLCAVECVTTACRHVISVIMGSSHGRHSKRSLVFCDLDCLISVECVLVRYVPCVFCVLSANVTIYLAHFITTQHFEHVQQITS